MANGLTPQPAAPGGLTTRQRALQELASRLPAANQQVAVGQAAARDIQLQQAIAAAPVGTGTRAAQALVPTVVAQAGQQAAAGVQQAATQQAAVGRLALGERAMEARRELGALERGVGEAKLAGAAKIANLSEDTKNKILGERLNFQRDETGRALLNERQLADLNVTLVKDRISFEKWAQESEHVHKRKIQVMETAFARIQQSLESGYLQGKQKLDQQTRKALLEAKQTMTKRIAEEKADAANKATMWQTGGMILGGAAGGFATGSPAGAGVGMAAGGALGAGLGSKFG